VIGVTVTVTVVAIPALLLAVLARQLGDDLAQAAVIAALGLKGIDTRSDLLAVRHGGVGSISDGICLGLSAGRGRRDR
jgi:hypothetical protein